MCYNKFPRHSRHLKLSFIGINLKDMTISLLVHSTLKRLSAAYAVKLSFCLVVRNYDCYCSDDLAANYKENEWMTCTAKSEIE